MYNKLMFIHSYLQTSSNIRENECNSVALIYTTYIDIKIFENKYLIINYNNTLFNDCHIIQCPIGFIV